MPRNRCSHLLSNIFSALKTENACHKEFAQSLYRYILHGENTPYNVFEVRKRNDGLEESERIRALQILLLLSRFFDTRDFDSDMYKDLESISKSCYLFWILNLLLLRVFILNG